MCCFLVFEGKADVMLCKLVLKRDHDESSAQVAVVIKMIHISQRTFLVAR
jgi:hypothetical protein